MTLTMSSMFTWKCKQTRTSNVGCLPLRLRHVVRTRILLTRIDDWKVVADVHGEFFSDIRPVNTIMQVSRFIDPDWLVEIEAAAVIDDVNVT